MSVRYPKCHFHACMCLFGVVLHQKINPGEVLGSNCTTDMEHVKRTSCKNLYLSLSEVGRNIKEKKKHVIRHHA